MDASDKVVLSIIAIATIAVLGSTSWRFVVEKNYPVLVEAACDPVMEVCFHRECAEDEECPPNEFSDYTIYTVTASEFARCADSSCKAECESGTLSCSETVCGESEEDLCSGPTFESE